MVLVDIKNEEIRALDVLLDAAKVKPIVGFAMISLRYRIETKLRKNAEKAKADETRKVVAEAFKELVNKTNVGDKHGNIPL